MQPPVRPPQLDYEPTPSRPRPWRVVWHGFTALAATALVVGAAAFIAQRMGWGTPLVAVTHYGVLPPRTTYLYGLTAGRYYLYYSLVVLLTLWLPPLWVTVFLFRRFVVPRRAREID